MDELKKYVANILLDAINRSYEDNEIAIDDVVEALEIPKQKENGDYAFPCFRLAKNLKNSPVQISTKIQSFLLYDNRISKVEIVSGYINFFVNSNSMSQNILTEILEKNENYGSSTEGVGRNIVIDYSSPNIAKPFHLGHFRNTVLGRAIYNLYKNLGYNLTGINYLGDWGRQFGLIIEGYLRYKDEYEIEKDPLHILSDIYVRISKLAKEDEKIMDLARQNFKKLEDGDEEYLKLWKYFRDISLKEYERIYKIIGCKFDSYNGEAYYNDKMNEIIRILDSKGVLVESDGAKVVFVNENEPPCIIVKSDGATIYATRDLAAILDRSRTYDFEKAIYITSYEQIHHFKQVFEVAKNIVDDKYSKGLIHIPYGMVRLKTGKMSTRDGNVIYLQDLIEDAINKAEKIIEEKNASLEERKKVSSIVGLGALVFNSLKQSKVKDIIFDLDEVLRFDGETGPYVQYTYVRTKSILKKAGYTEYSLNFKDAKLELLNTESEVDVIKLLGNFEEIIKKSAENYEPAILARYLIDIATAFSRFYNDVQVNVEDIELKKARCTLVYATGIVIKKGLSILGIECPDQM